MKNNKTDPALADPVMYSREFFVAKGRKGGKATMAKLTPAQRRTQGLQSVQQPQGRADQRSQPKR
jgi:hypothetical protein